MTSGYILPDVLHNSEAIALAIEHAQKTPDKESCGAIVWDEKRSPIFFGFENTAAEPDKTFCLSELGQKAIRRWRGERSHVVVFHSHVRTQLETLSPHDIYRADKANIPYLLLYGEDFSKLEYYEPTAAKLADYEGRPWRRYSSNCFTLIRDFLKRELDFDLERSILHAFVSIPMRV